MLFTLFTFFTQYANIFGNPGFLNMRLSGNDRYFVEVTSVANVLVPAALMMGALLLVVRRWQLPFGAVTVMFTINALLMLLMRFDFASPYWCVVIAAGLGGLFADISSCGCGLQQCGITPCARLPSRCRLFISCWSLGR